MKRIMYVLILLICCYSVIADYEIDLNDCPITYQSQDCVPGENVCAYVSSTTYCGSPSTVNSTIPSSVTTVSTNNYDGTLGGGYVYNCLYSSDSNCDTWQCQRDSSCYDVHRETNCSADIHGFVCDNCISGFQECDGSYTDGDGCEIQTGVTNNATEAHSNINSSCGTSCNSGWLDCNADLGTGGDGCEVQNGGSCNIGGLSGTYSGCTCVVDEQHHLTKTQTQGSSDYAVLRSQQLGIGAIANFTNATNSSLIINGASCIIFPDGTPQCTASTGGGSGDNASWNESYANTLYLGIDDQRYNNTDLIVSNNDTINLNLTAIWNNFINYYLKSEVNEIIIGNMSLAYTNDSRIEALINNSWNESYADIKYYPYNENPLGYLNISSGDNSSWNESYANTLYSSHTDVNNNITKINLNLTAIWNNFADYLISTSIYAILSGNISLAYANDSRIEALINNSWNESYANTLYLNRTSEALYTTTYNATYDSKVTDNESWNESLANSLYLGIDDQRYNNTDLIVSNNDTINLNLTAIWNNFANYLITTSIYTILSGNMTLAYVNDSRIETKLDSVGNWSADEQGIRDDITNNASATLSACYLNDTNNSAGNGIALTSSVFSVAAGNGLTQDASGLSTDATTAGANQYSYWDGNSWEARNDDDTTYSAGNGMGLSSTTFSVSAGNGLTQDASGLSTNAITASTGQYSYWDGNSWEARNDNYSTSLAFTGTSTKTLTITGRDSNTFSNTFTDIDTTYSNSSPINLTGTVFGLTPCPDTQIYAYNSSYGGWECQSKSSSGGGTVTSVSGDGDYVLGTVTSAGSFTFNESRLNATIDLRSDVAGVSSFLNYTPGTYNGSLVSAGAVGYEAGTLLCNSAYSGSHMCTMDEVIRQQNNGEYDNFTATFWVSEGAPGFTANANDCIGWKGDTATFLGAIWVGNVVDGGNGALTACNNKRALGCCI